MKRLLGNYFFESIVFPKPFYHRSIMSFVISLTMKTVKFPISFNWVSITQFNNPKTFPDIHIEISTIWNPSPT